MDTRRAYYEAMPTDELEEILRETFFAEDMESVASIETIDLICQVLAKRRGRSVGTPGAAWKQSPLVKW